MQYEEWERGVPATITNDPLWRMRVYRLSLFSADLSWRDASQLLRDGRTRSLADQLYRAVGSVSANIAEGYSRGSDRDRVRFYEYALGSAWESRDWYFKARHVLSQETVADRMQLIAQIIRLLLVTVSGERGRAIREEPAVYDPDGSGFMPL